MLTIEAKPQTFFRSQLSRRAIEIAVALLAGFESESSKELRQELSQNGMEVAKDGKPKDIAAFRRSFIKVNGL